MANGFQVYVGTYTGKPDGPEAASEGIYRIAVDGESGVIGDPVLVARCPNPSYLALHPGGRVLYAVTESLVADKPEALSFAVDDAGDLTPRNRQPIPGDHPCHVTADPAGHWLATAQYTSGDFALYPLAADGSIEPLAAQFEPSGSGPNPRRQEGPHGHFVRFNKDSDRLDGVDLGIDRVLSYRVPRPGEPVSGESVSQCAIPAGAGPRHMAVTGDERMAVVVNELDETAAILSLGATGWDLIGTVEVFPCPGGTGGSLAAVRFSPDERHVYATGRRQSEVAVFAVDRANQSLTRTSATASGGIAPRDMIISADGRWALTANQNSSRVVSFARDGETGALTPTGSAVEIGSACCLVERPT